MTDDRLPSRAAFTRRTANMSGTSRLSPATRVVLVIALVLLCVAISSAQTTTVSPDRIAKLEQQIADAKSSADNAWMLISAALVLMMTGPGLALFYGGLVRKKNVLATMMQSFAMMAIVTTTWAIFGYTLAFGDGGSFIG